VLTRNTTESLNLLAYSLSKKYLKAGDEVLLTKMEHHSNIVPWQQLALDKGFTVKYADITESGELDLQDLQEKISKKTKIVSFAHCSNVLGTINDAKEISRIAKDAGALSIVDGAQSVPHFPVDFKKIGCDFLAFSGHKMLGPTGVGVLVGKKERFEEMPPFLYGGDMISEVFFDHSTWNDLPFKFEAGTPHSAGAIGFSAAVDYLKKLGMEDVARHERELAKFAFEKLSALGFVQMHGPAPEKRDGVVSFNVRGIHPHDVGGVLDEYGIEIRTGSHCAQPLMRELGLESGSARMSFYVYNYKEDIELAVEAIQKTFKMMG
ncbi:MAG: cysteine desulfurase, partial [Patescibacteria group bacterium]